MVLATTIGGVTFLVPRDAAAQNGVSVTVQPAVGRDIGGYREVQRIFGLMWGGNIPRNVDQAALWQYVRALSINAGRMIENGWISRFPAPQWYKPWGPPPPGREDERYAAWHDSSPRFEAWEESFRWWDAWMARTDPVAFWRENLLKRRTGSQYTDGSAGSGYELTICANGQSLFDGRSDRNRPAAARHFVAMAAAFQAMLTHDIRLRFFQISNEPNDQCYLGQFRQPQRRDGQIDTAAAVDAYTRVFNEAFRTMNRELPGVTVVGSDPGWMAPFYYDGNGNGGNQSNWQMWAKRFIDGIEDPRAIEYYNYHAYSVAPSTHLAYLGLTRNHAWLKHGRKPRSVITETSHFISRPFEDAAPKRREQFLHTLEDLFMQLERPDIFGTRHQYYGYGPGDDGLCTIEFTKDGQIVPQVNYWALWAMNNTRGTMLAVADSSEAVRSFACANPPGTIVVSLFNPSDQALRATVDSGWKGRVRAVRAQYAAFNQAIANCDHGTVDLKAAPVVTLELKPQSVSNVAFDVGGLKATGKTVAFREFFGDRTELNLDSVQTLSIPVTERRAAQAAVLRLALEHLPDSGTARVALNGNVGAFNWQDAPRSLVKYAKWLPREAAWIGIPVNPKLVGKSNTLVLEPMKGQRLLYAAMELTYGAAEK